MERESDFVDGGSLLWEAGMEVIKALELWQNFLGSQSCSGEARNQDGVGPLVGGDSKGSAGEILSVDQNGMGWGGVIAD